jgi:hypothetical protein
MMSEGDKLMAWAQIWLSILFLSFVFTVTIIYEMGLTHFNDAQDKNFSSWMNWLQGAALIVIYFWFQRTRSAGIPDPSQVVTQTHTTPDGARTTVTTPVGVPNAIVPLTSGVRVSPVPPSGTGTGE